LFSCRTARRQYARRDLKGGRAIYQGVGKDLEKNKCKEQNFGDGPHEQNVIYIARKFWNDSADKINFFRW